MQWFYLNLCQYVYIWWYLKINKCNKTLKNKNTTNYKPNTNDSEKIKVKRVGQLLIWSLRTNIVASSSDLKYGALAPWTF